MSSIVLLLNEGMMLFPIRNKSCGCQNSWQLGRNPAIWHTFFDLANLAREFHGTHAKKLHLCQKALREWREWHYSCHTCILCNHVVRARRACDSRLPLCMLDWVEEQSLLDVRRGLYVDTLRVKRDSGGSCSLRCLARSCWIVWRNGVFSLN